jgi:hypothetical protein
MLSTERSGYPTMNRDAVAPEDAPACRANLAHDVTATRDSPGRARASRNA